MKKTILICLFFITLFSVSACSEKVSSQQVVKSGLETPAISPTPGELPAATVTATPQNIGTPKPVTTPQKTATPEIKTTPEPSKAEATPQTPSPSPVKDSPLVFIDAGHGGNDPGASGNGLVEKEVTLEIAKMLNQNLVKNDVKTYMVRTEDKYMDHRDRIYLANDMKASLYISIHCDWFDNPKYSGTQTFYTTAKDLKLGELTELQYAKLVQNELINTLKSNNRGISDRPTLAAVKYATMPSILVETGFLSNPEEAANLGKSEYRQKIADAMSSAIMQSLKKANLK